MITCRRLTIMTTDFLWILAILCVLGGRVSAQGNLLPQGNFENPGVNTGWAEGFSIPNNQEFRVISEKGKPGCALRIGMPAGSSTTSMPS